MHAGILSRGASIAADAHVARCTAYVMPDTSGLQVFPLSPSLLPPSSLSRLALPNWSARTRRAMAPMATLWLELLPAEHTYRDQPAN